MIFFGVILIISSFFSENLVASETSLSSGPKEVVPHSYPFIVTIGKGNRINHPTCGGTLISKQYVITAAHCIIYARSDQNMDDNGNINSSISQDYKVGVGVHQIRHPDALISIESIKVHPAYTGVKQHNYDIALIKLSVGVEFSDIIRPMCLLDMPVNHVFRSGTIAGFGYFLKGGATHVLMEDIVPIWSNSDCNRTWTPLLSLRPNEICIGGNGSETCFVTAGGPLFATFEGKYYFLGFALYGDSTCGVAKPDIYLRVPDFTDWIKQNSDYSGEQCAVPNSENL